MNEETDKILEKMKKVVKHPPEEKGGMRLPVRDVDEATKAFDDMKKPGIEPVSDLLKKADEIKAGMRLTTPELTVADPGFDKTKLNNWRVQYVERNLLCMETVSGDPLDLVKWVNDHINALIISVVMVAAKRTPGI